MTAVGAFELATWVPLAVNLEGPAPSIDWGDLGGRRFGEPFFDETIARWAAEEPSARVQRTGLDMLVTLDQAPSLDPDGLIFHASRCGSTLLARLLRQMPGCVVVAEPNIVNTLLLADRATLDDDAKVRLLRLVIRALARRRLGDERHYVVKLSSWNIRKYALFARAFPRCPALWLQRRPAEVLRSLLARSPAWLSWRETPAIAAAVFGIAADEIATLEPAMFYARALAALMRASQAAPPAAMATLDYAELPDAAWTTVAPRFGMCPGPGDIARMRQEARYDAKETTGRLFEPRQDDIAPSIGRLADGELDELYRALKSR
jgi:hypothetical protein